MGNNTLTKGVAARMCSWAEAQGVKENHDRSAGKGLGPKHLPTCGDKTILITNMM